MVQLADTIKGSAMHKGIQVSPGEIQLNKKS
jgi:hypothetical protein